MADKKRVLVVDDNEDIRILVPTWLKELYNVDTAVDGNECVDKVSKRKYDIILLDVMMPGPKPGELINFILNKSPSSMVIYLTAVEMFSPTEEQERKGFTPIITKNVKGYINKPIDKRLLIEKINKALEMTEKITVLSKTLKSVKTKNKKKIVKKAKRK